MKRGTIKLEVYCPKTKRADFAGMGIAIERALGRAKQRAEKNGSPHDLFILFAENALKYKYDDINEDDVKRAASRFCNLLAKEEIWTGIGFAVMHRENGSVSNSGVLVSQQGQEIKPKRMFADGDWSETREFANRNFGSSPSFDDLKENWENRGDSLEKSDAPFPTVISANEYEIEHRVCRDAYAMPINDEPDKVTLVSADGLEYDGFWIPDKRGAVIVNDPDYFFPYFKCDGKKYQISEIDYRFPFKNNSILFY